MDYGARFRVLRKARWKGTVLELARKLGSDYSATIYNIERSWRVPTLPTLDAHAAALGCAPWDLLEGVDTEVDRVRALARLSTGTAARAWRDLLQRYEDSTERGHTRPRPHAKLVSKR